MNSVNRKENIFKMCILYVLTSGMMFSTAGCFAAVEVIEPHDVVYTSHAPVHVEVRRITPNNTRYHWEYDPYTRAYHRVYHRHRQRVRYHNRVRASRYHKRVRVQRHHKPRLKKRTVTRRYNKRGKLRKRTVRRRYR